MTLAYRSLVKLVVLAAAESDADGSRRPSRWRSGPLGSKAERDPRGPTAWPWSLSEAPPKAPIPLRLTIQIRAELMWDSSTGGAAIRALTKVDVNVDTPAVFKLVPMPLLEAIVRRATRIVLDALLEVFLQNLAADYERWASDAGYRASRAALSPTPDAAVSRPAAAALRSVEQQAGGGWLL